MAVPTYIGSGTKTSTVGATQPAAPSSWQADDILICTAETNAAGTLSLSSAEGFAEVTGSPQAPTLQTVLGVFWKRATSGSDTMPTFNDAGDHCGTQVHVFRGCKTSGNPWNATNGGVESVSDTSWATVGVTTTVADCLIVEIVANGSDQSAAQSSAEANANLANLTEVQDSWMSIGDGGGFVIITGEKASPGATGSTTGTFANAAHKAFLTIALEPAGGGAQSVSPGALALTLTPVAPVVTQKVTPGALALTVTPVAPVITQRVVPGALSLTLTPVAPVPVQTNLSPGARTLTLTPVAPLIQQHQNVSVGAIALTLSMPAPFDIPGGAITFTNLGESAAPDFADDTDQLTYTTASWTPPNGGGGLIAAWVYSRNASGTTPATPEMSGNGLDWVEETSHGGTTQRVTLFLAEAVDSTTGVTTIDFGAETQTACIVEFTYVHQVNGVARTAANAATGVTANVTLGSGDDTDNRMMAAIGHALNNDVTPRTNWVELDDIGLGTTRSLQTQYRPDATETTGSGTWSGSATWVMVAAEFDHREVNAVNPNPVALTIVPVDPVINVAGAAALPAPISLTLTPVAPVITAGQQVSPGALALTLTPRAPAIGAAAQSTSPAAITLTLTVPAPPDITGGAITFTNLGESAAPDFATDTDASNYQTASWTPPNGDGGLIIAYVYSRAVGGTTPAIPSITGNGTSWGEEGTRGGTTQRVTMFSTGSAGTTTGATTIDFGGENQTACIVSFFYVHQVDGIVQVDDAGGTGVTATVTLSAASDPDNRMIAGIGHPLANDVTPRANWTELDDLNVGTTRSLETQYRGDAAESVTSGTWTGSAVWTIVSAEFDHRIAGTSVEVGSIGLSLGGPTPLIEGAATQTVSPGAIGLTLTPVQPTRLTLVLSPAALALTVTPVAPAVSQGVNVAPVALTLTPVAPAVVLSNAVRPVPLALTLTPVAPSIPVALGELGEVTNSVRIGATWFVPGDTASRQAGRVRDVQFAGGFYYIATEGADRAQTLAGVTHTCNSLIRVNATTMDLDTSWLPTFNLTAPNMELHTIATDGTTIWVGGNFDSMTLGGITYTRSKVIAINATTGVPTSWSPGTINNTVRGLAHDAGHVYVVGEFTSVGGTTRNRAASLSASTAALESWNPNFGVRTNDIRVFTATGGAKRIVIAMNGNGAISGSGTYNLGVIGAIGEGDAGTLVWGAAEGSGGGHVCAVSNQKQRIFYGTKGSGGNVVWCYNATGTKQWSGNSINTNGDIQALDVYEGGSPEDLLYVGTHDTSFSSTPGGSAGANVGSGFARFDIDTGNFDNDFFPGFRQDGSAVDPYDGHTLKVWRIRGFETRFMLVVGGDFTRVDTLSGTVSPAPRRIAFFSEAGAAIPASQVSPQPIALSVRQPAGGWDDPWDSPWDAGLLIDQGVGAPGAAVSNIALTLTVHAPLVSALRVAPDQIALTCTAVEPHTIGPEVRVDAETLALFVTPMPLVTVAVGTEPGPTPTPEGTPVFAGTPTGRKIRVLFTRPR